MYSSMNVALEDEPRYMCVSRVVGLINVISNFSIGIGIRADFNLMSKGDYDNLEIVTMVSGFLFSGVRFVDKVFSVFLNRSL